MRIRGTIRKILERTLNVHIFRDPPRGLCLRDDIAKFLPALQMRVIFDVGANIGQSTMQYKDWYKHAQIFSFEPASDVFEELRKKTAKFDRIRTYNMALGATQRQGHLIINPQDPTMNYLIANNRWVENKNDPLLEIVKIQKLDDFCEMEGIKHINFLKIDTEGSDLAVLLGAELMLSNHNIDIVEVEAGMNPDNKYHVSFDLLKAKLESLDYFLFAIYEQVGEWLAKRPHLRRTNPVFISRSLIEGSAAQNLRKQLEC